MGFRKGMKLKYFQEIYVLDFVTDPILIGDKFCSEGLDKDGNQYIINWLNSEDVDWECPCDVAIMP
jgi:hypothetical protein